MKKIIISIAAFFYIGTTTGAVLHLHYCMGTLAGWELFHQSSKKCGKCGMEKSATNDNGCCKDENKFLKNVTDQQVAKPFLQLQPNFVDIINTTFVTPTINIFLFKKISSPITHPPPPDSGQFILILHCVFLI